MPPPRTPIKRGQVWTSLANFLTNWKQHCHAGIPDRRKYWDPFSLSYSFLAEARRLWELERDQDTLVVAEAAMLLHIAYCHNGIDQLGHDYLLCGLSIGQAIGLFDQGPLSEDQTMSDAMVFAAWSFYRWTTWVLHGHGNTVFPRSCRC